VLEVFTETSDAGLEMHVTPPVLLFTLGTCYYFYRLRACSLTNLRLASRLNFIILWRNVGGLWVCR